MNKDKYTLKKDDFLSKSHKPVNVIIIIIIIIQLKGKSRCVMCCFGVLFKKGYHVCYLKFLQPNFSLHLW